MALTVKLLKGMGIDEDKIEAIITAHTETTEGLKSERDSYKEQAKKVPDLQRQLEEAKADTSLADLQAKFEELQAQLGALETERDGIKTQFDAYKQEVQSREDMRAKAEAYRTLLKDAGIAEKYLDSVVRVTDLSSLEMEDGRLKEPDRLGEEAKSKWADFILKTHVEGSNPATPPKQTKGGVEGANPRALQIAKERHERMYGKTSEE